MLKAFRERLDLTQTELANELHISYPTINRWENGKTSPTPGIMRLIRQFALSHAKECPDLAAKYFPDEAQSKNGGEGEDNSSVLDTKAMENLLWQAACSIRGEKDAPKFKDYILPLIFIKRLSDVFEDEITRLIKTFGNEVAALEMVEADHGLVRFYIPQESRWAIISGRKKYSWPEGRSPKTTGELVTGALRAVAKANNSLQGVIDIVDYNETRNGEREISDAALSRLIEILSKHRLGLTDVEPDFLGRAYEYLLRKFAESQGQSAGEFFTPLEVGRLIAKILNPQQGEEVYDPCCGSGGLLIKCELDLAGREGRVAKPLKLHGQELMGSSFAIARMNMVIHDMEGEIVRGNTMTNPKFRDGSRLKRFDLIVTNPMWNQDNFEPEEIYEKDPLDRFSVRGGFAPRQSADWAWLQHIHASLKEAGRAAVVLDTGAAGRGSGSQGDNKEKSIRKWFVEKDLIEAVILLPDNLFYNTTAAGVIIVLNNAKPRERKGKVLMINAAGEFEKGRPKNFLPETAIENIAAAFQSGKEAERFAKLVKADEIAGKNDFNLSPSRYVETSVAVEHKDIQQILNDLAKLDKEAARQDGELKEIFAGLGYKWGGKG